MGHKPCGLTFIDLSVPPRIRLSQLTFLSRWSIMQKVPKKDQYPFSCMNARHFRFSFTPSVWVLFTFPSRYLYTIGVSRVQSFEDGSPLFAQSIRTTFLIGSDSCSTGLLPSLATNSIVFEKMLSDPICFDRFRSPLLSMSRLICFLRYWDDSLPSAGS